MLERIYIKYSKGHLEIGSHLVLFYIINLFAITSTAELTALDESLVTVFTHIATNLPDNKISSQEIVKTTLPSLDGKRDYVNSHGVSRNRYFSSSSSNLQYEVLSNHAPSEINVNTSRDKNPSSQVEKYDLPPWPTKDNIRKNSSYNKNITTEIPSKATDRKNGSETLDVTTIRLRLDNSSSTSTSARLDTDSESSLIPPNNRQSYVAPSSPFVVMNNHKPRPFMEKDKVYSWVLNVDESTNSDITTIGTYSSMKTSLTTIKPVTQTKSTTEIKRKSTSVTKSMTTSRPVTTRKTYRPYDYTAYSGTTEMSIPLTTRRPSSTGHAVGLQSFRPLATFMSHAVMTIVSLVQKSFLNSLLVLIPSALLGLLLL